MNELKAGTNNTARILVVDDEPDMADLMQRKFRHSIRDGLYDFLFAEDGYDALRVLENEPDIDLVITDINMPRMDGLTLLNHLEEVAPLLKSVIVSAYGDMENIRTAMNRGAFDFVTKPINFSDLEVTIKKTLTEIFALRKTFQEKETAQRERGHLARYFSPAVVDRLVADPSPLKPGVERREMSFVFTDIADFTSLVEKSELSSIAPLLNDYFGGIVDIAYKHEGTIDKVVGDGINIFFNAPISQHDHAERALACAIDIDDYAQAFAQEHRANGEDLGTTRIGVNTGEAVVGNFGCHALLHYTAYGDVVNTASRLQTANRKLGTRLCVSASTVAAVSGFTGIPVGELLLKGKTLPVMAYQPRKAAEMDSPSIKAYLEAYKQLEAGDESALDKFKTIVETYPDAYLAAYQLMRLRNGETGIQINLGTE